MEPRMTLTPYQNLPIEAGRSRVETLSDMGDLKINVEDDFEGQNYNRNQSQQDDEDNEDKQSS